MAYNINDLPEDMRGDFSQTPENKGGKGKNYSIADLPPEMRTDFVEKPKLSEDVARSAGSGTARGIAAIPGMIGTMGQIYDYVRSLPAYAIAKVAEKTVGLPHNVTAEKMLSDIDNIGKGSQSKAEREGYVNKILGLPVITSKGSMELARRTDIPYVTRPIGYKPKTPVGSIVQAGFEAAPQAVAFGPANWGSNYLMGLGMGTAGEGTRQLVKGTEYEKYETPLSLGTSLLAGLPFAGYQAVKQMRSEPETTKRALSLAGQAQREAYPDARAAAANLAAKIAEEKSGKYLPGTKLSTAQLTRSPADVALENRARRYGTPVSSEEIQILDQNAIRSNEAKNVGAQSILSTAESNVPKVDMAKVFDIQPDARLAASTSTKEALSRIENEMFSNEKSEWLKLQNMGAAVDKKAVVAELDNFIKSLGVIPSGFFPKQFTDALERLKLSPSNEVPFTDLQTLRSIALATARKAYQSDTPIHGPQISEFANRIKSILDEPQNIIFPDESAISQWNAARAASNTYHDFFGEGKIAGKLTDEIGPGVPKVSPESTLDKMLLGDRGAENLRQIRATPGMDVDKHVSDWMVSRLTSNGTNLNLKPEDVIKFMSDPKNQAIIREVPGLADRIQKIGTNAGRSVFSQEQSKLVSNFEKTINQNDPARLAKFISENRDALKDVIPPSQHAFLEQLENSASALSALPSGKLTGSQTMDMIANGNLFTLLYGKVAGRIPSAISSSVAGLLAGGPHGASAGFVSGLAGITEKFSPAINNFFSNYIFGDTQHQALMALQRASHDPEFALLLMQKPSPEVIKGFMDAMNKTALATGRQAAKTAVISTPKGGVEQSSEEGDRMGRASGGRITNHKSEAENLIRMADKVKKALNNSTESLLSVPDEAVTKALSIANEAI